MQTKNNNTITDQEALDLINTLIYWAWEMTKKQTARASKGLERSGADLFLQLTGRKLPKDQYSKIGE